MATVSLEPPRVVVEQPTPCAERDAATLFAAPFAPDAAARAPGPGWVLRVHVTKKAAGELRAEGQLVDAGGALVAQRRFTSAGTSCAPLANALGVWGALVLDEERSRAMVAPERPAASTTALTPATSAPNAGAATAAGATPSPSPSSSPSPVRAAATTTTTSSTAARPADDDITVWPPAVENTPPPPEQDLLLRHAPEERSRELGASGFLMNTSNVAFAGGSLFTMIELGGGMWVRPRLFAARSVGLLRGDGDPTRNLFAARVDLCVRIPGLYPNRRGIQLDACGGAEGGASTVEKDASHGSAAQGYAALGPGLALRGDLTADLAAELRGEAGVGVAVGSVSGGARGEMALSWRLR